ncbi:hypothetical protein [Polaribacter tangerinus]|uniref:hypothetical protein n=1 Tax=Polaribacter tangerinus TaxID=1920034 RepID=UPI000B4B3D42|nr:hypothetical protein [Polaribacter tangerinus]
MKNNTRITAEQYHPSPIQIRECKCGCGHEFQPNRKDQLYIDKRHYDFDYNQTKRKEKNKNRTATEKQLRLNNRVLEKHYIASVESQKKEPIKCYLDILKAEGFLTKNHTGVSEDGTNKFYLLYDYYYRLFRNTSNQLIIEIYKNKLR